MQAQVQRQAETQASGQAWEAEAALEVSRAAAAGGGGGRLVKQPKQSQLEPLF